MGVGPTATKKSGVANVDWMDVDYNIEQKRWPKAVTLGWDISHCMFSFIT